MLSCVILIGLFALQHFGTHRVGFLFAPIVIIWLVSIFGIGVYNIVIWNPKIVHALSPYYIVKFFRETRKHGWFSLGGVLLSVAGTSKLSDLFSKIKEVLELRTVVNADIYYLEKQGLDNMSFRI